MSMSYAGAPMITLAEIGTSEPTDEQYEILGRLVAACSQVEIMCHELLKALLKIDDQIARKLLGEPRIGDLITLIRFALTLHKIDQALRNKLEVVLEKAAFINSVRSVVAHKPFFRKQGDYLFHNSHTAKDPNKIWQYRCTTEELFNLGNMAIIVSRLLIYFPFPIDPDFPGQSRMFDQRLKALKEIRVLPSPPVASEATIQKAQKRQQKSSGA